MWKPELLAPAKNLERLNVAIAYGADAIYVGGQRYGLRARADNFTDSELEAAANLAHTHQAKLYVTLNAFLHDEDFAGFADYCHFLEEIGIDAVIVSDLGVIRAIQDASNLSIHLSTQASCLNSPAAKLWKQIGVDRIVVGRELSVAEGGMIQRLSDIEIEMFVHGAMCMAYSGNCTISNFIKGRDSNRGGCVQSCRLPYQIQSEDNAEVTADTILSSTDLWGIGSIEAFFEEKICSLKVEGRMKSSFYVAMTCRVYRTLIDAYAEGRLTPDLYAQAATELQSAPHRDFASGSLQSPAKSETVYHQTTPINEGDHDYLGIVLETTPDYIVMKVATALNLGDEIELMPAQNQPIPWRVNGLHSVLGESIESIRQDNVVCLPKALMPVEAHAIAPYHVARIAPARRPLAQVK